MDAVLRQAKVVDGSGAPGRYVDVEVHDGVIRQIGEVSPRAGMEEIDLSGLILAPGFIDIHTHFDAQIFWDGLLTPSSWHGVTTVFLGNCGFGIAPLPTELRDVMLQTLANVEGMSPAALAEGVDWTFTSFPGMMDAVDQVSKQINVAFLVGHTPVRLSSLGMDAFHRPAAPHEVADMRRLLREACEAGAVGFSTSDSPQHVGAFGLPVPSRLAESEEVIALCDEVALGSGRVVQGTLGPAMTIDVFSDLAARSGLSVLWSAILSKRDDHAYIHKLIAEFERCGQHAIPQIACKPLVTQVSMQDPSTLGNIPAFQVVLGLAPAQREACFRDPQWRREAKEGARRLWGDRLDRAIVRESRGRADLIGGPRLDKVADLDGADPMDLLFDIALADDLATRFEITMINDDADQIGELLQDRRFVLSLSDAGAHASQLCDADFATQLLGTWVREKQALTWEDAIWRLTGHPASLFGMDDRGLIRSGYIADLVAFDPDTVGSEPLQRVWDLPGAADRLIVESKGIHSVWVAGTQIRSAGQQLGATPGRLLRWSNAG